MKFLVLEEKNWKKFKVGGLDSRDQSRSRSRMSFLSRLTFLKCRDFLDGRDRPFFLGWDFKIETFQSRLGCVKIFIETVKIFKIYQDFLYLLQLFKIYWDISTLSRLFEVLKDQKSRQIDKSRSRNMVKLTNSRLR